MDREEVILYRKQGKTAFIALNRPDKNNAINIKVRRRLAEIWQETEADPNIWSVVLTGSETVFSTGFDMVELAEFRQKEPLGELPFSNPEVFGACCSKPVIAAISGFCLGGAFFMAMVGADIRIASSTARFGMPEVKIGITPAYGIPPLLASHFPQGVVMDLLLTGRNLSAEDAFRYGFLSQVVPEKELLTTAESYAETINALSPLVLRNIKSVVRTATAPDPKGIAFSNAVCLMSRLSEDYIEGPKAFREKRKPIWKGR